MDEDEARRRFAAGRVARLATIDARGRPHLVPVVFVVDGGTIYSPVDDKPKRTRRLQRLRNLEGDPNATMLVDHYDEDWPAVWWVRARGAGRLIAEDTDEYRRADALLTEKYPQYREDHESGPGIAIDVADWLGWAYTE
ncbi:MAG: TIGR03668 family PPOX class F420-dependent oxidoreductase [Actinomycetota bacterium]